MSFNLNSSAVIPGDRFYESGHWEAVWTVLRVEGSDEDDIPHVLIGLDDSPPKRRRIPLYTLLVPRNFRRINAPRPRLAA